MNFKCDQCNYATVIKSNFTRHQKSFAHTQLPFNGKLLSSDDQINDKLYKCDCGKTFSHQSGLSRHKKECKNITNTKKLELEVEKLKSELTNYKTLIDKQYEMTQNYKTMCDKLIDFVKTNKPTVNNNYISVKNYVQQNFPDAPALEGVKDYAKLTFEDNDLIDTLIYNYENEILHRYLGKFIIGYYKKDDPSEQSLWTSDVSRLTYVIKELLESNKSIWSHDFKGVKVKLCIVNPLLRYIRKCIDDYWIVNLDHMKSLDTKELVKLQEKFISLQKIKKDIGNEMIANNIIRFIAPHFYMEKRDLDCLETNETFIEYD
ncbi:zinc finger C2H2-type protein [Fadolivirus algeromassiliense]|jgi:hypothetical protein|uniref:Zinc finger C2H2-type protein n=1 Tax=Fadolivirus FV1/VV64 TaxID=3070911 RepID=A0A7D3V818_9VIRU|nr:zinc finger C2H2-type protein [Fadolivirus algeromassiliense]QKF94856.1 zinc finger C2H2-type protein [Fadolivirus FV1/VV64]